MKRLYDVDWLRSIIVLSIIPFHASIIFIQDPNAIMFVKDTMQVNGLVFLCTIVDRFHMVTLFLLAGMAIYFSLLKRSKERFLKERFLKLFIPLLTGSFLLNPITTYIWFINQGKTESFLSHYKGFFTRDLGALDGLAGGYTPAHLWFILYLFVFSFLGIPLFTWLMSDKSKNKINNLATFFCKPYRLLLLAVPYCLIFFIEILDEKNPIAYFYIVLIGFIFATNEGYIKALCRDKWIYLIFTVILYVIYFTCEPSGNAPTLIMYFFAFVVKLTKIIPAFMLIGFFHAYINKKSKVLSYLSGACFTVYIVHMVIVTSIGFFIIQLGFNPYIKYFIIVTLSYIISFLVYEIARRNRILGILVGNNTMKNIKEVKEAK